MDVHSIAVRSYNMSRILSMNTKPELIVRKYLFANGIRYRLHDKKLPGKPDIVVKRFRVVIFVNGCFWHQHKNCKYASKPKSNRKFWNKKLSGNVSRDKKNISSLRKLGYRVFVIWECKIKKNNFYYLKKLTEKLEKIAVEWT